jgi:hypothetical protein
MVIVKMLKTFTNEKHAHMYLVYGSCNGNGGGTSVAISTSLNSTLQNINRTLRECRT